MPILAKCKFVDKKMKMYSDTEHDKNTRALMKQFAEDNNGKDFFMELYSGDEINFHKGLVNYYTKIMLPALFVSMKDAYGLDTVAEADAVISVMFSKREKERKDEEGKKVKYAIVIPIKDLSFSEQGSFITKVANLAISKYGIRFPSATEITKNINQ